MGEIKRILGLAGVIAVSSYSNAQSTFLQGDSETVSRAPDLPKFITPKSSIHTKRNVVKLKGNRTVTLEYLFHRHKDEYSQWLPNGKPSIKRPENGVPSTPNDFVKLGCVFKVGGLPAHEIRFAFGATSSTFLGTIGGFSDNGQRGIVISLSNPTSSLGSISIGIPSAQYHTWYSGKLDSKFSATQDGTTTQNLTFQVPNELVNKDVSFLVTDHEGNVRTCRSLELRNMAGGNKAKALHLGNVPLKIQSIKVQYRDYDWVTFDNVCLAKKV